MVDDKIEPIGQETLISRTKNLRLPYKTYKVVHKENALLEDCALLCPYDTIVENGPVLSILIFRFLQCYTRVL